MCSSSSRVLVALNHSAKYTCGVNITINKTYTYMCSTTVLESYVVHSNDTRIKRIARVQLFFFLFHFFVLFVASPVCLSTLWRQKANETDDNMRIQFCTPDTIHVTNEWSESIKFDAKTDSLTHTHTLNISFHSFCCDTQRSKQHNRSIIYYILKTECVCVRSVFVIIFFLYSINN